MAYAHEIKFFFEDEELYAALFDNPPFFCNEFWIKNVRAKELGISRLPESLQLGKLQIGKKYKVEDLGIKPFHTTKPEFEFIDKCAEIAWKTVTNSNMSETCKYQNQYNFYQGVGIVNGGDVKIEDDQIGIQHNYASEKNLAEVIKKIQDLLNKLSQTYPKITEVKQQEFIDNWEEMVETYPIKTETDKQKFVAELDERVRKNPRIREVLLVGGIEFIKILCPYLGIPIEMGKKWLETVGNYR